MSTWENQIRQELSERLKELQWDVEWLSKERLHHRSNLRSKFAKRASVDELNRVSTIQSLCAGSEYAPAAVSVHVNLLSEPSAIPHSQKHPRYIQNTRLEHDSLYVGDNYVVGTVLRDPEHVYVDDGVQIGSLSAAEILRYGFYFP